MAAYLPYLSGFLVAAAWWYARPRLRPRAWLGWWWLGLLLFTNLPASLAARLLYKAHLPYALVATPAVVTASKWLGAVLLIRILADLTRWERPRKPLQFALAGAFLLSLLLAPWGRPLERITVLLFGPLMNPRASDWAFVVPALLWLWSFRWRERVGAFGLLVASATALVSFPALTMNCWMTGGAEMHIGAGFGVGDRPGTAGFEYFAWQVKELAGLYALFFLLALTGHLRLVPRRVSLRLVYSHVLAAVPPMALALAFVLLWSTAFLSTYRGEIGGRVIRAAAGDLAARIGREPGSSTASAWQSFLAVEPRRVLFVQDRGGPVRAMGASFPDSARDSLLATPDSLQRTPLLFVAGKVYLHARVDTVLDGRRIAIVALEPMDSLWMERVSGVVGAPTRLHPQNVIRGTENFSFMAGGAERSIGPVRNVRWNVPGGTTLLACLWWVDGGWEPTRMPLSSSAAFGEPILALRRGTSAISTEQAWLGILLQALWAIGLLFLAVLWWVMRLVLGTARTVTRTTGALTRATGALAQGDFSHRIPIEGHDELWGIAESFNDMAGRLEKMREVEHRALRLEKELEIARQVQQGLFPSELPQCQGWEVAATCRPARQVGGDYYDAFVSGDDLVFALGDVSGKGLGPALLMSNAQATVRSRLRRGEASLSALLDELNQQLLESSSAGMFITLFIGIVDTRTGRLRYANGGHNPPYLCAGPGAEPRPLTEGGVMVGALPGMKWDEYAVEMTPGSTLFVYSDGLTEAVNETGEMYEEQRLQGRLVDAGRAAASDLLAGAFEDVDRFRGRAEQSDDMSVVVIRRQPT